MATTDSDIREHALALLQRSEYRSISPAGLHYAIASLRLGDFTIAHLRPTAETRPEILRISRERVLLELHRYGEQDWRRFKGQHGYWPAKFFELQSPYGEGDQ